MLIVGLLAWVVPGAGHFLLREKKRALIILVTILLTLCAGLYIGSIGVIDFSEKSAIYVKVAQAMNPPIVLAVGHHTSKGSYPVYGWPNEIGQVYTMTSGLLNLLCVVNAVYMAYLCRVKTVKE